MSLASIKPAAAPAFGLHRRYQDDEMEIDAQFDVECLRPGFTITDPNAFHKPGPDIQWIPSYESFLFRGQLLHLERVRRGLEVPNTLPTGFPAAVSGDRVWTGKDLQGSGEPKYVLHLDHSDLREIDNALESFLTEFPDSRISDVARETFHLPTLGKKLAQVSETLHFGLGFTILRGLDPAKYSQLENVIIYAGICKYIGPTFGIQDSDGSYLIHIKDVGKQIPNSGSRQAPYTNMAQPFHCDSCDILAMYALNKAQQGGASYLASTAQVYNDIARTRPDIIDALAADDWIMDKQRTERGKPSYWYRRPILFNFPEHGPGLYFNRRVITGSPVSPRNPGVPPMTEEQAEALDMVHFTAERNQLKVTLERGDIMFVNNFAVLHAREAYQDSVDGNTRHMMRLWLRDDQRAWKTPHELTASWIDTYGPSPRRAKAKWDVEVPLKRERVLARSNSCS